MKEAAADYIERGWSVIPIPPRAKAPVLRDWPNLKISQQDVPRYWNGEAANIGILLGEPSEGLVDIDLDSPESIELGARLLPPTATFGHGKRRRTHYLYCCPGLDTQKFAYRSSMIVEARSNGCQTVFPPSVHESGEPIVWDDDRAPAKIGPEKLLRAVRIVAAGALLAREWPREKSNRHERAMALAGGLLRAGWTRALTEEFILGICEAAGETEQKDRLRAVLSSEQRQLLGRSVWGWPKAIELFGEDVIGQVLTWLEIKPRAERAASPAANFRFTMLADVRTEKLEWLWYGRIPRGMLTLLAGEKGLGKSLITADLAARISAGRGWPNDEKNSPARAPGDVIILSGEDDPVRVTAPRLRAIGADESRIVVHGAPVEVDQETGEERRGWLDLRAHLPDLRRAIEGLPDPVLLILDPVTAFVGGLDGNSMTGIRSILGPLAEMASDLRLAVLGVVHPPKVRYTSAGLNIAGSRAWGDTARMVLAVAEDEEDESDEDYRILIPATTNLLAPKQRIGLRYKVESTDETPYVHWIGEATETDADMLLGSDERVNEIQRAEGFIREQLAGGSRPAKEMHQLAGRARISRRTLMRAKKRLGVQSTNSGFGADGGWLWSLKRG